MAKTRLARAHRLTYIRWHILLRNMAVPLHEIQKYANKRVRMRFDDGLAVAACLTNITQDADGSIHLVYDHAEKLDGLPEAMVQADQIYYATGQSLVEIYALHDPCDT